MLDENIFSEYLTYLLDGDKNNCHRILISLIESEMDVREIYLRLIQDSMYKVGDLWEFNKISVATEHMATSITESLMALFYPLIFSSERTGKSAVISCVANEYHQIGGRMVADIFELNGWDGYFIGANSPITDMLDIISQKQPDLVGLSLSIYFRLPELAKTIESITEIYPDLRLLIGGQAFRWGGMDILNRYNNVEYISSLNELESIIING